MSAAMLAAPVKTVAPVKIYPFSDGKRMAENTKQAFWIFLFMANLQALLREIADVLVATDILWYPVEGEEKICTAPDVLVAFGRPRGHRLSYLQWDEGGIPPQVVIEIVSPSNTWKEMADKFAFYEEHGVQEYYVYDPESDRLEIYIRGERGAALVRQRFKDSFVSPMLKIRFDTSGDELRIYRPDGERFLSPEEIEEERQEERGRLADAEQARSDAEQARSDAEQARSDAEQARSDAQKARRDAESRLMRMQELVGKILASTATPDDMAELRALQAARVND